MIAFYGEPACMVVLDGSRDWKRCRVDETAICLNFVISTFRFRNGGHRSGTFAFARGKDILTASRGESHRRKAIEIAPTCTSIAGETVKRVDALVTAQAFHAHLARTLPRVSVAVILQRAIPIAITRHAVQRDIGEAKLRQSKMSISPPHVT